MSSLAHRTIPSPLGDLAAAVDDGLRYLSFPPYRHVAAAPATAAQAALLDRVQAQLDEYFVGVRREFDLPLTPEGTAFQRGVWAELLRLPYATTISYGELARRLGSPGAARAVGAANGANPIAIIIPCHRVIDAAGRLHGYGGGLERKRWLLDREGSLWSGSSEAAGKRASVAMEVAGERASVATG